MNVVDSSGWLEYFANGENADFFAPVIEDTKSIVTPSICLAEVFKRIVQQRSEDEAIQAISVMEQTKIIELTASLAITAAKLGIRYKLPLADSIILAAARVHQALLWTQDADFEGIEGIKFIARK